MKYVGKDKFNKQYVDFHELVFSIKFSLLRCQFLIAQFLRSLDNVIVF